MRSSSFAVFLTLSAWSLVAVIVACGGGPMNSGGGPSPTMSAMPGGPINSGGGPSNLPGGPINTGGTPGNVGGPVNSGGGPSPGQPGGPPADAGAK